MCLTVLRVATNRDINIPKGGSFDNIVKLKYQKNIDEGINKAISKRAEVDELKGVIDITDFNSEELGTFKEAIRFRRKLLYLGTQLSP